MAVKKISYYCKASTLIETLMASVLSAISFTIALSIYLNVIQAGIHNTKETALDFIRKDIILQKGNLNNRVELVSINGVSIETRIEQYKGATGLRHIQYEVRDKKGKLILEKNFIYYNEMEK